MRRIEFRRRLGILVTLAAGGALWAGLAGCGQSGGPPPTSKPTKPTPASRPTTPAPSQTPGRRPDASPTAASPRAWSLGELVPESVGAYPARDKSPRTFDAETITREVDGDDKDYLSYAVRGLAKQIYVKPGQNQNLTLYLFDLGRPACAFGVFSYKTQDLPPDASEPGLGDRSLQTPDALYLLWDRFYVRIDANGEKLTETDLRDTATAVLQRLQERVTREAPFAPPPLTLELPAEHRLERSVVYFTSGHSLNGLLGLGDEDLLAVGSNEGVEGAYALYDLPAGEGRTGPGTLFLLAYPREQRAAAARRSFVAFAQQEGWSLLTTEGVDFYTDEQGFSYGLVLDGRQLRLASSENADVSLIPLLKPKAGAAK